MKKRPRPVYIFDEIERRYVEVPDTFNDGGTVNPCVEITGKSGAQEREESVVAYVDELTGGMSAQAEEKLRALLRGK